MLPAYKRVHLREVRKDADVTDSRSAGDIAVDFVAINEYLSAGGERSAALSRLVMLAVASVHGCDWAAVTVWPTGRPPRTLASSAEVARAADPCQYDAGEGPCMSAASEIEPILVPDLAVENRWPLFRAALAAATPVRGVLSFHLAGAPDRTALNLYSGEAGSFDIDAVTVATLFATHARVLVLHADSTVRAAQLIEALTTSRQIGAAVGVLMHVHKIDADQAFALLRTTSQQLNRKLRSVADDVTHTGTLPEE